MRLTILIIIMAGVTYVIRALPLSLFRKEITSKWLRSFLYYIPYAVLGAMTFPAIFFSTGSVISASFGLLGALLAAFLNKGLMTAALSAVLLAFLSGLIL